MAILTGSPISTFAPYGLECTFEYGGLTLNDRSRGWSAFLVTGLTGLDDADIRDGRDVAPDRDGETALAAFYGGRSITIRGQVRALNMSELRQMQGQLRSAFASLLTERSLIIRTGSAAADVFINCRKNQPLVMAEEQTTAHHIREFLVSLRASDPRFRSVEKTTLATIFGTSGAVITCDNVGNWSDYPNFTITGPFTTLSLRNRRTNDEWALSGPVPAGETWYADGLQHTLVRQTDGANRFAYVDEDSRWLTVEPGENEIDLVLSGSSGSSRFEIDYRSAWM